MLKTLYYFYLIRHSPTEYRNNVATGRDIWFIKCRTEKHYEWTELDKSIFGQYRMLSACRYARRNERWRACIIQFVFLPRMPRLLLHTTSCSLLRNYEYSTIASIRSCSRRVSSVVRWVLRLNYFLIIFHDTVAPSPCTDSNKNKEGKTNVALSIARV